MKPKPPKKQKKNSRLFNLLPSSRLPPRSGRLLHLIAGREHTDADDDARTSALTLNRRKRANAPIEGLENGVFGQAGLVGAQVILEGDFQLGF